MLGIQDLRAVKGKVMSTIAVMLVQIRSLRLSRTVWHLYSSFLQLESF